MVRYTGPKNRIARRYGVNIFGRKRNPMLHKPNPPGVHGARRRKKSDFGLQLNEQQKLKAIYGMLTKKQLVRYFRKAVKGEGNTVDNFQKLLECRLDNIVYKLKLAPTIFAAQQLICHGHVHVNGKKVDIRSFQVRPGMEISIREKSRKIPVVIEAANNTTREVPPYLEKQGEFVGKMAMVPECDQIDYPLPINVAVITDFLAHTT